MCIRGCCEHVRARAPVLRACVRACVGFVGVCCGHVLWACIYPYNYNKNVYVFVCFLSYLFLFILTLIFFFFLGIDGNPDILKNSLINFGKRELVYNILREIQDYQQTPYKTPLVDNIASFLDQLPHIHSENDMYDLSLLREPRNAEKETLL